MKIDVSSVPIFILAGGLGTRLKEETEFRPKPMVPIGGKPILWHLMRSYHSYGFKNFIICAGHKADIIKSYFLNYHTLNSDFTVNLSTNDLKIHSVDHNEDWNVTVAFTGELTMTGGRVARAAERYLGDSQFFGVTYGDGLSDLNLKDEFLFHLNHEQIGTVMGHSPPSRFGELKLDGSLVTEFAEKPSITENWINAGFFFFRREFINYLSKDESCILERDPLVNLARDKGLRIYKHNGFWACMDTQRDMEQLNKMWATGKAPWEPTFNK